MLDGHPYLLSHGWRVDHETAGFIYLTRPGKPSGISGLLGFPDDPTGFYCFTGNAPAIIPSNLFDTVALCNPVQ